MKDLKIKYCDFEMFKCAIYRNYEKLFVIDFNYILPDFVPHYEFKTSRFRYVFEPLNDVFEKRIDDFIKLSNIRLR